MADFPEYGSKNWAAPLKQYIDDAARPVGVTRRGSRVIVIGDSIDQSADTAGVRPYWGGSIWSKLAIATNSRFHLIRNVAIGGQATIQMRARFKTDVLDYSPDLVVIGGGRNDLNGGVPTATTRANITAMVEQALAAGVTPVLHTLAPVDVAGGTGFGTIALNRAGTIAHNAWLVQYAASVGVAVLDLWKVWADVSTGGFKTGYSTDGVHPTGDAVWAAVDALRINFPGWLFDGFSIPPTTSNTDPTNLLPNAWGLTDANSDGIPDLWYFPDFTKITVSTTTRGSKMMTITTPGTQQTFYSPTTKVNGFSTGDVLALSGRVSLDGATDSSIMAVNQAYAGLATPVKGFNRPGDHQFYMEYTVEAGVTGLMLAVTATGTAGKVGLAEPCVHNLTRLGIV